MKTLCADLGGTRLKLAAVENGVVLENEVSPIETNSGMEKVLENLGARFRALLDAAERYVNDHAWTPWGKVKFIVERHPEDSVVLGLYSLFVHHVC